MEYSGIYVLIINAGSSSLKFALYEIDNNPALVQSGMIERIGHSDSIFTISSGGNKKRITTQSVPDHNAASIIIMDHIRQEQLADSIHCIGHRIVYGLQHSGSTIITDDLLAELQTIAGADPDHMPAELGLIRLFQQHFSSCLQAACFDTAFHAGLPKVAKILPIPRRFEKSGVRRFGFHGLSYTYLMRELSKINKAQGKVILAHLGNGCSLAALSNTHCMDTTMGFTPAGGIMMGERPGDLDPGVAWFMMQQEKLSPEEFNKIINHESGLLGVSGASADMRQLLSLETGMESARDAVNLFCYTIKKWIGAYIAVLGGLDTLVFAGGIGEKSGVIRARVCEGLGYAGITLDPTANDQNAFLISIAGATVQVYVINTNEELIIAEETYRLYKEKK